MPARPRALVASAFCGIGGALAAIAISQWLSLAIQQKTVNHIDDHLRALELRLQPTGSCWR